MKIKNLILTAVAAAGLACCSIEEAGAQVFASLNVSSNTVPAGFTNTVSGTGYANLDVKSVAVFYSFVDTSTNGTFTIPFQSSPDSGTTWYQVPTSYLAAGTTNQIVYTPSTTVSSTTTNTGMVVIDTSRGQMFRAYQFLNAGQNGGVSNLTLQVYYP